MPAARLSARIIATCRTLRFRDIARWRVSRLGLASNNRLGDLIERVFESRQFEELRIPLAVVATDLTSGEPVVFTQGNLVDAIRASCAFPGLFEPVDIGTRCLADGGLVAPVPTRAARELGATTVVGISVGMQDGHRGAPTNIFQVVSRAVSAAQKHQLEIWERHADIVLRPDVQSLAWDDFDRAEEAIEAGAAAARRALPRIQKALGTEGQIRCADHGSAARSRRQRLSVACGGSPMIRLSAWLAALTMLLFLWHECGEDVGVFCYRIGLGAFTNIRSRSLVLAPVTDSTTLSTVRTCSECSTPSSTFFHSLYDPEGLKELIRSGGAPLVCTIVFIETGFFVGFFLPGDSLLITAGIFSAMPNVNPPQMVIAPRHALRDCRGSDRLLDWPLCGSCAVSPRRFPVLPARPSPARS